MDEYDFSKFLDKLPKKAAEEFTAAFTAQIEDITADAAARVAQEAEAVERLTATLNKIRVQFGLLGLVVGTAAGALVAFTIAYRKAETKYSQIADDEIAEMREHYQRKGKALEAEKGKGDLDKIVKDRGYASPEPTSYATPPMAVQPPAAVLEGEDQAAGEAPDDSEMGEDEVEGANGVKEPPEEPPIRNIFRERDKQISHEWDEHKERSRRTPDHPYVIHYDERHDMEGYSDISLTYYVADDVLCDDNDEVMDPADRDDVVGEANLDRFGHGSNDADIVFIRNDNLEIMYEIVRSPNSYAEEVHGLKHHAWDRGNLERMRSRERMDER